MSKTTGTNYRSSCMATGFRHLIDCLLLISLEGAALPVQAGYKTHTRSVGMRENYSESLTNEDGIIVLKPLFKDEFAAEVLSRDDMVTRGIMPVAIHNFNDNGFANEICTAQAICYG